MHCAGLYINVPGGDGLELLNEFRNTGNMTPAIIITSFTNIERLEEAYLFGCNDYLKKPFDRKELELKLKLIEEKVQDKYFIDENNYYDIKNEFKKKVI